MLKSKIKELMEVRDMSLADLSKASKIPPTTIVDILNGKSADPRVSTVKKLAVALRVRPSYLLEDDDKLIGPKDILPFLSEEEREWVLAEGSAPFIRMVSKAHKEGLSHESLEYVVRAFIEELKRR